MMEVKKKEKEKESFFQHFIDTDDELEIMYCKTFETQFQTV